MAYIDSDTEIDDTKINFTSYIQKFKLDKDDKGSTHTCFGAPWGAYKIENHDEFIKKYTEAYELGEELHVIERQKNIGPLLIDLDFKFDNSCDGVRYYTEDHIFKITKIFTNLLKKYYECPETSYYRAYVLEKPQPTHEINKQTYKDGFHIQYPNLPIDKYMRYIILMEAKEIAISKKVFDDINFTNSIDDVFDVSVVYRNGWLMYGSKKKDCQLYKLTKIYNSELNVTTNKKTQSELIKLLSIRKFDSDDKICVKPEINDDDDFNEKYEQAVKIFDKEKRKKEISYSQSSISSQSSSATFSEKVKSSEKFAELKKQIIKLLGIMDLDRAINYAKWINVGWALHNIDPNLIDCFIEFSKRYPPKFNQDFIYKMWDKARDTGFGIASIHWWAKHDNPKEYAKILSHEINELIINAENGSHYSIACVLHAMYKHTFVCTSISKCTWYEFKNHRWREIDQGYTLDNIISNSLTKEFALLVSTYYAKVQNEKGPEKDRLLDRASKLSRLIEKLGNSSFKKCIMSECSKLFYLDKFEESLDDNKDLIGFNNGVYDLVNGVLRDGTPDDRITLSTDYDFIELNDDDEKVKEVKDFFEKIMLDGDMREYLYLLIASYLEGHIRQQHLVLWTGSGSNGKSSCTDLIKYTFGQYYDVLPVTVITRKRSSSSSATPELANKRGIRFIALQEPEGDDQVYVGYMKELTGGDWVMARPLYKEPFKFKPQFKLVIPCNKLPHIPSDDGGTWRRLRVTPWESKFVDGEPSAPHEFKKDFSLGEKMKLWNQAFMWLLLKKYFPLYVKNENKIHEPPKVTKYTDEYKIKSDQYLAFINDNYDITGNKETDKEVIRDIYLQFKGWHKENSAQSSGCPSKHEFVEYFKTKEKTYKVDSKYIYGIKFRSDGL